MNFGTSAKNKAMQFVPAVVILALASLGTVACASTTTTDDADQTVAASDNLTTAVPAIPKTTVARGQTAVVTFDASGHYVAGSIKVVSGESRDRLGYDAVKGTTTVAVSKDASGSVRVGGLPDLNNPPAGGLGKPWWKALANLLIALGEFINSL